MVLEDGRMVMRTVSTSAMKKLLLHHKEKHFTACDIVRDIIMNIFDGLTIPFILATSLSDTSTPSYLILTTSLVEVTVGTIFIGLGGCFLSSPSPKSYCKCPISTEVTLPSDPSKYGKIEEEAVATIEEREARWMQEC